jgi:hypothetical protein
VSFGHLAVFAVQSLRDRVGCALILISFHFPLAFSTMEGERSIVSERHPHNIKARFYLQELVKVFDQHICTIHPQT